jgi:hypothetical protein
MPKTPPTTRSMAEALFAHLQARGCHVRSVVPSGGGGHFVVTGPEGTGVLVREAGRPGRFTYGIAADGEVNEEVSSLRIASNRACWRGA